MRRFLIWSALAIVVGAALAGVGYWAYWNFFSRFQPVTVSRNQAEIQQLLDEASWVSAGGAGAPLYIIGYRDSTGMARYEREEADKLRAAGVDARVIVFARPDREGIAQSTAAERATVAELWLTRDWSLYQRWTATPVRNWTATGIPAADGNLARTAVIEAGRQFDARLPALLEDAGAPIAYPVVLWRDREGFLKACACADSRAWPFIRDDLGAPDRIANVGDSPASPIDPADTTPVETALPYPALPPIPPANAAPSGQAAPPSAQPRASQAPAARPAPQAKKQDDATFF